MEKSQRNKGRLVYSTGAIYLAEPRDAGGYPVTRIALMDRLESRTFAVQRDDNAKRLVECWNACEGVDYIDTTRTTRVSELIAALENLRAEYAEALDALGEPWRWGRLPLEQADAALALVRRES